MILRTLCFASISWCVGCLTGSSNGQVASSGKACDGWNQIVATLSSAQRRTLEVAGVVYTGEFIIGSTVVADCESRSEMGRYFTRVLDGKSADRDSDRTFARRNSLQIARVLAALWPKMDALSVGDGSFDEVRYVLLREPALRDEDWAGLINGILGTQKLSPALVPVIMDRPLQALTKALRLQLSEAVVTRDTVRRIYCLVCLQRLGEPVVNELRALAHANGTTAKQRLALEHVLSDIDKSGRATFQSVSDIEYDEETP